MINCSLFGFTQIFITWCNPKDNSDTERVLRTLKEDFAWTNDRGNPLAFQEALKKWINDYNANHPHQSLNNMTPRQYLEKLTREIKDPITTLKTAC